MWKIQSLRAEQSRAEQSRAEQLNGCIRLGNLNGKSGGSFAGQVYSKDGQAPTLTDMQGGGRQPHIVEVEKMEQKIKIRQATKQGFIECEVPGVCDLNYADSTTRRGRVIEGGASISDIDNGEYP